MKCTNNKPTSIKIFLTLFFLCTTTVLAVIPVPDYVPSSYGDRSSGIWKVVDDWIAGGTTRASVESTYGLIQDWDTSEVTNMHQLFYSKQTFDANLAKWNVAKVTKMNRSTFQFPLFNSPLHNLLDSHSSLLTLLFSFHSLSLFLSLWNFCSVSLR